MPAIPRVPTAPVPLRRAVATVLLLCAASLAALLLTAAPAAAHASLLDSAPATDEVVDTAPEEVVLTFSEEVATSEDSIRVLDPDGTRIDDAEIESRPADRGSAYGVRLDSDLADGTYTVAWQVISADSHPISGAFTFSVGAPSETAVDVEGEQSAEDDTVTSLYDVGRFVSYGSVLLLVGSAVFVLRCWPAAAGLRLVQRLAVTAWTVLTAATLVLLLLRQPYTTGGGVGDAFGVSGLGAVLETTTGTALAARLLLLAVVAIFLAVLFGPFARARAAAESGPEAGSARGLRDLTGGLVIAGVVLALGIAATWSLSEHAATGPQTGVAIPADMAHLVASGAWLGGLVTLLFLLFRPGVPVPRQAVLRFSVVALVSVVVVAGTGLYQSWRQVQSVEALFTTAYGQLLLVKVGLVALLLVGGWFSRRWTARLGEAGASSDVAPVDDAADGTRDGAAGDGPTDPVRHAQLARQRDAVRQARARQARDADRERGGLRRSVLLETAAAVLVVAVTTALTGTNPARVTHEEATAGGDPAAVQQEGPISLEVPFDTGGTDGQGTAFLDVDPGEVGDNTLHLRTEGPDGEPLPAEEVRIALTLPTEDIGPIRYDEPLLVEPGHWTQPELQLPRPGEWEIALTIRTSEIHQVTETETVQIG